LILFLKALLYILAHPFEPVHYTIVRRYADAQKHFIGELYEGDGRYARMIGMSCDSLSLEVAPNKPGHVQWGVSFLDPMLPDTIRAGGATPDEQVYTREYVSLRRFSPVRITVLNRFVEHILASDYADRP